MNRVCHAIITLPSRPRQPPRTARPDCRHRPPSSYDMRGDLLERNALRRHSTLMDFAAQFSSARPRAHSVVFRIAEAISFQLMPALLLGIILGSAAEGQR